MFGKKIYEMQIKSLKEIRDKMFNEKDAKLIDIEIRILVSRLDELVTTKFVESIKMEEIDPCGVFSNKSWEIDLPKDIKILIPNGLYEPMKKSRYIMSIGDAKVLISGSHVEVLDKENYDL